MKVKKIEIKNRFTGKVLFEFKSENNTVRTTVLEAYKRGAYLRGADGEKLTIKNTAVFTGLYKYIAMPIIAEDGKEYVRLGCYTRLVSEWENDFWNNPNEFPNNDDNDSKYRKMAYEFCKQWIEINR